MTGSQKRRLSSAILKNNITWTVLETERSKLFVSGLSKFVRMRCAAERHKAMKALPM